MNTLKAFNYVRRRRRNVSTLTHSWSELTTINTVLNNLRCVGSACLR